MSQRDETRRDETTGDDAGCGIDWSWLAGEAIVAARSTLDTITFQLQSGRTLTVRAGVWNRRPFLMFDPWRAP